MQLFKQLFLFLFFAAKCCNWFEYLIRWYLPNKRKVKMLVALTITGIVLYAILATVVGRRLERKVQQKVLEMHPELEEVWLS